MPNRIVLASASPRRQELLKLLGFNFDVLACDVDERVRVEESPEELVQRLARAKAEACRLQHPDAAIIAADTVVVCGDEILGKPSSRADARRMLRLLSGREHAVYTGVGVCSQAGLEVNLSRTRVRFLPMNAQEIEAYLDSGEPMDKAGAYAIQGRGARFIEGIEGCYFNVVGLPLSLLYQMLKRQRLL